MFLKFASRRNRLNSSWNCSICVKKRFWVITSEFSALPENVFVFLRYLSSFVWALTTASQAKLFRFVLQHLFGRTKFSVTYNGEGAAFVLEGCVQTDATTPNIVAATMLGVVACVLAVVCKRMQQLPTMLGPAVHRGKDTTHKSL